MIDYVSNFCRVIKNVDNFQVIKEELNDFLTFLAEDLVLALKTLVNNGGIGPEDMFDDARCALEKWETVTKLIFEKGEEQ